MTARVSFGTNCRELYEKNLGLLPSWTDTRNLNLENLSQWGIVLLSFLEVSITFFSSEESSNPEESLAGV